MIKRALALSGVLIILAVCNAQAAGKQMPRASGALRAKM
jgi:hypothetical protein